MPQPTTIPTAEVLDLLQTLGTTVMLAKDAKRVTIQQLTTERWSVSRGTVAGPGNIVPGSGPQTYPSLPAALADAAVWLSTP